MGESLTPRVVLLSALYAILLLLFATLLYFAMIWFANSVLFGLMDWFNRKSNIWKIIILFAGGSFVLVFAIYIFQIIGGFLSAVIFGRLPLNWFTGIFAVLVFLLNVIIGIISMWEAFPNWNFWYVLEFIFLCLFVLSVNYVLLPIFNKKLE